MIYQLIITNQNDSQEISSEINGELVGNKQGNIETNTFYIYILYGHSGIRRRWKELDIIQRKTSIPRHTDAQHQKYCWVKTNITGLRILLKEENKKTDNIL